MLSRDCDAISIKEWKIELVSFGPTNATKDDEV